jgi:hypothetical protein
VLGDYGFRYSISGRVAPSGPLMLDKGHWAASAIGHAWVFDLVTGTKVRFMTAPVAANRVVTRWGPGYQTNVQGDADFITTLQAAADCRQGNIAVAFGMSNYTPNASFYDGYLIRESISPWVYGSTDPAWVVEGDASNLYWDNGNSGGLNTNNDGGINAGFSAGRDGLNVLISSDNGTSAGTVLYHNGSLRTAPSTTSLIFGTNAAATDSIQIGNNFVPTAGVTTNACFHFVYVFKRALSRMEILSLNANPYQMWVPENVRVRFSSAGAPASPSFSLTGTAATGGVGSIGRSSDLLLSGALGVSQTGTPGLAVAKAIVGSQVAGQVGALSPGSFLLAGLVGATAIGSATPQAAQDLASSVATASIGTTSVQQGPTAPGTAATGSAGSVSFAVSPVVPAAVANGVVGTMRGQNSFSVYFLGLAGAGAAGTFSLSLGRGLSLGGQAAAASPGSLVPEPSPTILGASGSSLAAFLTTSGDIVAPGSGYLLGAEASGAAGDMSIEREAIVSVPGVRARAGAGTLTAASPGVWVKPRVKVGLWVKEF